MPRPTPLDIGIRGWLETFGRSFFEQFEEPERAEVFSEVIELLRLALCDADGCGLRTISGCVFLRSGLGEGRSRCPRHTDARFMAEALV